MKLLRFFLLALLPFIASAETAKEKEKPCFACSGSGTKKCEASRCKAGKRDCPSPCLKLSVGKWEKMDVPGHDPSELWQKFHYGKQRKSWKAWTHNHAGEIVGYDANGVPEIKGKCPTCKGSTKVNCDKCQGTGAITCSMCNGSKKVPDSWTDTSNPKVATDPNYIHLKDGRVIRGKIVLTTDTKIKIRTESGTYIDTTRDQVISK